MSFECLIYVQYTSFVGRSTLRSFLTRAYKIFSTKELLDEEFKHIKREFIEINGYPK